MEDINMFKSRIRYTKEELDSLADTVSAFDNKVRILILEMLEKRLRDNARKYHTIVKYPLNINEIDEKLQEKNITLVEQGIRDHVNKLEKVGLIGKIRKTRNKEGKPLPQAVNAYYFNILAFDCLMFENQLFAEEIQSYLHLYKKNQELKEKYDCVITVFTGFDKSEVLTINEDERGYIGRDMCYPPDRYGSESLILSSAYETVTERHKPHLEVFKEDGVWYMMDNSENGTFISNKKIETGTPVEIPNDSFIQLSQGPQSAVLYISYN